MVLKIQSDFVKLLFAVCEVYIFVGWKLRNPFEILAKLCSLVVEFLLLILKSRIITVEFPSLLLYLIVRYSHLQKNL